MRFPSKDPEEILDYRVNWAKALDTGDTIASSTWEVTPSDAVDVDSDSFTSTATVVWLSGGSNGNVAHLQNTVTTAGGRTFVVVISLTIRTKQ